MSQQSLMQASVRAVTSTTLTYEGDWHALWDSLEIPAGQFNERLLAYINDQLDTSYTELNGAMAAFAAANGATTFQAIGTFTPGYEFTLAGDALAWTSGVNVAVPVLEITIPSDVPSGYKIRGQSSANSDMSSPIETISAEIAAGDLTDLQIDDFTFTALSDGLKYIQVWITDGSDVQASNKSNIVSKTLDSTAPTITSANSANNAENSVLAHALTANESVTWTITGGADAAEFEISGSTLRWASNGTQDYETPGDDGTNNTYVVQVTATDAATNATNQTVTITVTDVAEGYDPADLFATYSDGFWLDAATETCSDEAGTTPVTTDGTTILNWKDQSGNGRHWSIASGGPIRKNSIINSLPVIRFAADTKLNGATLAGLGSAAEIWAVIAIAAEPPSSGTGGLWTLGTATSDLYPYAVDSVIYNGTFSNARKTTTDPTPALTSFRLLNIWSAASDFAILIDGTSFYTTATNTVAFHTTPRIGESSQGAAVYLNGDIAEIICINAKATAQERTDVESYFAAKYGLTIA